MTPKTETPTAYRLTGDLAGASRSFALTSATTRLGCHSDCELVLDAPGVSRHHAVLELDAKGLIVEDAGSKNGTFVNGVRTARGRLQAGDELGIGSVHLRLEAAHPEDGHLALAFDPSSPITLPLRTAADLRETDLMPNDGDGRDVLDWLDLFVDQLTSGSSTAIPDALATACDGLGAHAVALASWRAEESPVLIGTAGESGRLESPFEQHRQELDRAAQRALDRQGWQLEVLGFEGPVIGLLPRDTDVLALAALGGMPDRATSGPLLRLLCKLLDSLDPARSTAESRHEQGRRKHRRMPGLRFPPGHVQGRSAPMTRLYREMETVAGGDYPVLILGETGCGKEMIANTLHLSSPRDSAPLVVVNCAAIPADLLEAEMFGVVRGAATGVAPRLGCFSRADGGTLFLDEVGELHTDLQAKLLRALEYGEVQPVGGTATKVDVRVISATNVDLDQRIEEGGFRADLYYRLAASVLEVPALRQRKDDLPALIQVFSTALAEELGIHSRGITQRTLDLLLAYPWPGNVRELRHELRRAIQKLSPGQAIDSSLLSAKLRLPTASHSHPIEHRTPGTDAAGPSTISPGPADAADSLDLKTRVAEVEKQVVGQALNRSQGNRTLAAQWLGISRNTLATKIALYGLG